MKTVATLPHRVRLIENVFIPAADGARLAAKFWLPEDAEAKPVPALLEYIPYRKRDFTAQRDEQTHRYLAGHGYASVRIDCRGAGDSDGVMLDEYLKQEHDDALDAIAWLARQSWCTGRVGMFGGSWGGFNSLQVAARRPPALRAIITVVSTDDRYADDMHYMGGALLNDMLSWGQQFFAQRGRPPDPAIVGERWREMWCERLDALEPQIATWLAHQHRDGFWKHGSVCEDFSQIQCPVYAIGGWADGYSNAVFRLLKGLTVPRKGLVGPWGHGRPHFALPGPLIGYLQESLRWWDHWLKDRDTGIMQEPILRAWLQESVPPRAFYDMRPGSWIGEPSWPSPNIAERRFVLAPGGLVESKAADTPMPIRSPESLGIAGGEWCPFGVGGVGPEMPLDQRIDDGGSLNFDTAPLSEPMSILGAPVAALELQSDKPRAMVVVRLSDIAPDGAATRVSYGVLNLAHRESHERPTAIEPGRRIPARVALNDIAHTFPRGHRLRLSISTAYWPIVWPSPDGAILTVLAGASTFLLPVRKPRAADKALTPFGEAEGVPPLAVTVFRPGKIERTIRRDVATGEVIYRIDRDDGRVRLESAGTILETVKSTDYRVRDDEPLSARSEIAVTFRMERADWRATVATKVVLTGDASHFRLMTDLDVYDGEARIHSRSWDQRIKRDLV
ncbi:MAG: CocE/NonD family hydrolase [Proteobacteria bacterium]|nr:CocE/NonD family hydrolase [Pseudomonadota bacterium]MBI3497536.1 CocE/NonD family hydrolase [Pseudomonadota bacterium]